MLVKTYKNGVEVRITMEGPGDIVAVTLRTKDGQTGPYYYPSEDYAIREVEAAMERLAPGPSKFGLTIATLLMLTVGFAFCYALIGWLASLPAAVLMALLMIGRG